MPRRYWVYILAGLTAAALVCVGMWQQAHAQAPGGYDCDVTLLQGGAFDAHCEPDATNTPAPTGTDAATATGTATPPPSATATLTPVVIVTATARPTNTSTATATAQSTNTPAPQRGAPRFAVMGDSFFDEYRADNNRGGAYASVTLNMVEILQRTRGFDFGPWGTWGGTRRTGYENNCALSGATSYSMIQGGQHTCVAQIVSAGKAEYVLVGIGANDFSPSFGDTYQRIYSGSMSDADLTAKINRAVQDVTTGVDAALNAGARGVLVVSFTQWGLDPSVAARFPNAAGRARVDNAIARVNDGLEAMAAARGGRVVIIDQNAIGSQLILPKLDAAGNFTVGGEKINFLTNGDEPHHAKLADGAHLGTVMGAFMANHYFIAPLNAAFGFNIAPLSEAEMLQVAGLRSTGTPAATATATRAPPTATATATAVPPTAQPTNTPVTAVTPAPSSAAVVNVPLIDAVTGDPALDANNWSIVALGSISPSGPYAQLRLAGASDGLRAYVQVMQPAVTGPVALLLNGQTFTVTYPSTIGWTVGVRGGRGWSASAIVPWERVGGKPSAGAVWPLSVSVGGRTWAGALHWGLPDYAGRGGQGAQVLTVPLTADSVVGGGTDCGDVAYPDYFPTWGTLNWGASPYAIAQNQWDTADWPCYAKYFAQWSLAQLPAGAQVLSATVTMRHFGNPGYGAGYDADGTGDTVFHVFEVAQPWQELGITWDNAPALGENVSRTLVKPIDITCGGKSYCSPGIPYSFDVTEIVKRAVASGRGWASMALYTAAGQYHSGKYFSSREGGEPPVVQIAYTMEELPTWTATPASTATAQPPSTATAPVATASATPTPPTLAPTNTPSATATSAANGAACTRTVSPGALAAAVAALKAGDVLCLNDGTYTEPIAPRSNGTAAAPITIRALHDGKVTIDGQGVRKTVDLQRDWWVIEGIVARNGTDNVFRVDGNNNVLRRVSAYDASDNINSSVVMLLGDNNLVEDAVVAGTGRYMAEVFGGSGNTLRRVFTMWKGWSGREFCGTAWPNGNNIGVYNASNATVENVIAYGRALKGVFLQANSDTVAANNNRVLGSIAVLQGRDYDGSVWTYGTGQAQPTARPGPTSCTGLLSWTSGAQRYSYGLWGQGNLRGNVFRDIIGTDNVGVGFSARRPYTAGTVAGNVVERATLFNNGADVPSWEAAQGGNISISMAGVDVQDSCIPRAPSSIPQGQGADLRYQYVNGIKTNIPFLPWSMEQRGRDELGISITAIAQEYIDKAEAVCR